MVKKIDIMGIQLDNYTVREAVMMSEKMLSNNEFNTILEVGMDTLNYAQANEQMKTMLSNVDNTIIADVGILRASGQESMQRKHEIEDKDFFHELFKRIERNHKSIYVLAENEQMLQKITEYINAEFARVKIIGSQIVEPGWGHVENFVNDINSAGVDVILSILPSPQQEAFWGECKGMVSANLWYGARKENFTGRRKGIKSWLRHIIDVHKLAVRINNYEEQVNKDE